MGEPGLPPRLSEVSERDFVVKFRLSLLYAFWLRCLANADAVHDLAARRVYLFRPQLDPVAGPVLVVIGAGERHQHSPVGLIDDNRGGTAAAKMQHSLSYVHAVILEIVVCNVIDDDGPRSALKIGSAQILTRKQIL